MDENIGRTDGKSADADAKDIVPKPLLTRIFRGAARRFFDRADAASLRRSLRASGLGAVDSITTWTTRAELAALYTLALHSRQGARILEFGSYLGASTCYLAAALAHRGGTLTCVDAWRNQTMTEGERDTFAEFLKNVAPVRDRLRIIRKRFEEVTREDLGGPFDLVFLDGDHSYDATRRDFELVAPLVPPNGIIAFHDTFYFEGVTRVFGEVLTNGQWTPTGVVSNLSWITRRDESGNADKSTAPMSGTHDG